MLACYNRLGLDIVMLEIHSFLPRDYEAVKEVLVEAEVYTEPRDLADNLHYIATQRKSAALVAFEAQEVVGFVMSTPMGMNVSCVWGLAVAERYRRQGIASHLLDAIESIARTKGFLELWGFVNVHNEASRALLASRGFQFNFANTYLGPWKDLST
jgi:ribosomal protein S18 acetylase RimI-like enzyme